MEKLVEQFKDRITDPLSLYDVNTVNHKPHPFTVGPKHVAHAAKYHGGILDKSIMLAIPCAARNCNLPYDEHTYDTVMFLQLTRDCTSVEAQAILQPLCDEIEEAGIDGFCFVETDEGYRIT